MGVAHAREARLAPEREQLIEQCVNQQQKERSFCENYYRDHGDGGSRVSMTIFPSALPEGTRNRRRPGAVSVPARPVVRPRA